MSSELKHIINNHDDELMSDLDSDQLTDIFAESMIEYANLKEKECKYRNVINNLTNSRIMCDVIEREDLQQLFLYIIDKVYLQIDSTIKVADKLYFLKDGKIDIIIPIGIAELSNVMAIRVDQNNIEFLKSHKFIQDIYPIYDRQGRIEIINVRVVIGPLKESEEDTDYKCTLVKNIQGIINRYIDEVVSHISRVSDDRSKCAFQSIMRTIRDHSGLYHGVFSRHDTYICYITLEVNNTILVDFLSIWIDTFSSDGLTIKLIKTDRTSIDEPCITFRLEYWYGGQEQEIEIKGEK